MKKAIITSIFLITALAVFSQSTGTISIKKPFVQRDTAVIKPRKRYPSLLVDCQIWKYSYIGIGTSIPIPKMELDVKALLNVNSPTTQTRGIATQLRYDVAIGSGGVSLLFGPIFYMNNNKSNVALTPAFTIHVREHIHFGYGYNYIIGKQEISTLNTHFFYLGIKYNF